MTGGTIISGNLHLTKSLLLGSGTFESSDLGPTILPPRVTCLCLDQAVPQRRSINRNSAYPMGPQKSGDFSVFLAGYYSADKSYESGQQQYANHITLFIYFSIVFLHGDHPALELQTRPLEHFSTGQPWPAQWPFKRQGNNSFMSPFQGCQSVWLVV